MDINLKSLGLEKRWPRLARLQAEITSLEKRLQESAALVSQLQNQLAPARDRDLDAAAAAVRAGKEVPHGTHEESAKRQLEAASRDRDVLTKAVESVRTDLGKFMQEHQGELYQDVAQARAEIASKVAEAAREALKGYSRYEDLHYVLKDLQPPAAPVELGPPGSDEQVVRPVTNAYVGVQTTRSAGPARGHVEQVLAYLTSLATVSPAEPGDSDAA